MLVAGRAVSDKLWQTDKIIITKIKYPDYLNRKWPNDPYSRNIITVITITFTKRTKGANGNKCGLIKRERSRIKSGPQEQNQRGKNVSSQCN